MIISNKKIISSALFKKTLLRYIGDSYKQVVRPACYMFRGHNEGKIFDFIILLPPKGYTANKVNLLQPHPEARRIKIKVLGQIRPDKKGYRPSINETKFTYSGNRLMPTTKETIYALYSRSNCDFKLLSWKSWVYVTKENGWGNYHNLINISKEWIVVVVHKELFDHKTINIDKFTTSLSVGQKEAFCALLDEVVAKGDSFFKQKSKVDKILQYPAEILIPCLISYLNVKERGKHEPCTIFALILKLAKSDKGLVNNWLDKAVSGNMAPEYYIQELKIKVNKNSNARTS